MGDPKPASRSEAYTQRDNPAFADQMAIRTASRDAAFFLPYLRSGMRVMDMGCGPGTITLGLAAAVVAGEVIGTDIDPSQVERARTLAVQGGVGNVRFEVCDGYQLPFGDGSFDAVFAHAVFMHLNEPLRALAEIRRVLRPGGAVGLRDPGECGLHTPVTPLDAQWGAVVKRVREHNRANLGVGRYHRRLLVEAGFVRTKASASVDYAGSLEETRRLVGFYKAMDQGIARTALAEGWVDQAMVDAAKANLEAWGERPDAFSVIVWCEAIGWKGE